MKVFVLNCGSSSIKFQVFDANQERLITKGSVSNIGKSASRLDFHTNGQAICQQHSVPDYNEAFSLIFKTLLHPDTGIITSLSEIYAVGHRVAHGGPHFSASVLVTEEILHQIERCIPLAPLHNPMNLLGIRTIQQMLPDVPQVAVFDTCFHQTIPPRVRIFPIPYTYYQEYGIQRLGFHSQSCRYVIPRAAMLMGRAADELKMVVCHLGHGDTITAVDRGVSVDTSLGFSTFAGLMMGTRPGDFDPGLIFYLNRELDMSLSDIEAMLYKESGLLGISGVSSDMKTVLEMADKGDQRCMLAVDMFTYKTSKFIGAFMAALGGMDVLVFTAGIGENAPEIRRRICSGLECLGIDLDKEKNQAAIGKEAIISSTNSKVNVVVVPTNEEQIIMEDTLALVSLNKLMEPDLNCIN